MRKFAVLLVFTTFAVFNGAALTEDVELHFGESKSLEGYTLSYENLGSTPYFEVTQDSNDSKMIVEQIENDDLLDMENETLDISEELDVTVRDVKSDSSGLYIDLALESSEDIFADANLDSSAPRRVFVSQGGEVTVPLSLENTGIVNQTFQFTADHTSNMDISFSYRDFNVTDLKVNTGESVDISARFDVPEMAEPGVYDVQLQAEGTNTVSENITVDLRESETAGNRKEIDVNADSSYIGIKPGEEKEVPVRVRNHGNVMLDNVEVSVNAPENWETEISRSEAPGLEQYESFRSIVTVKAPVNAETGDKFLEISASSDDTSTEEPSRVRMTVQKESNLRYIGLGIMGLSLGGLIFVYRKLGRR